MQAPELTITPAYPSISTAAETTLDVLLRLAPPAQRARPTRPELNLGVVLDRSGSMAQAGKINFAQEAAIFVVQELLESDRLSLTIFDDRIETLVPSTHVQNKAALAALIRQVQPRGSTALHAGWKEGAREVEQHLGRTALNRVLLLSDGLANVGETNPDSIATEVADFRARGVSTTTIGLGHDYNEDLLEAMAAAGDGNYYYVESSRQLPAIFGAELQGLAGTLGQDVRLRIEPAPGVELLDLLNDFETDESGERKLPNLVLGMPIEALVRLRAAPTRLLPRRPICDFAISWSSPNLPQRQSVRAELALPVVAGELWRRLAPHPEVEAAALSLAVARLKREYASCLDASEIDKAKESLAAARRLLDEMPNFPNAEQEREILAELEQDIEAGRFISSSKMAKYLYYRRRHSKPIE